MSQLIDSITQQLDGGAMSQIAQQIGADPAATSSAVNLALPMLLGGLAHGASQPGGAAALNQAVTQHDPSLLDDLGGMLGGTGGGMPAGANALGGLGGLGGVLGGMMGGGAGGGIGGAILGHVLGGQQAGVTDGVSRATGLQAGQVGKLLMLLAPIVMAALAKRTQQQGGDAAAVVQQEKAQAEQRSPGLGGVLGSIFGGGGNAADQIANAGPSILGGLLGGR